MSVFKVIGGLLIAIVYVIAMIVALVLTLIGLVIEIIGRAIVNAGWWIVEIMDKPVKKWFVKKQEEAPEEETT